MTRTMARRGAPLLIAAALFGGALATGGTTASAAEAPPVLIGSADGDLHLGSSEGGCLQRQDPICSYRSVGVLEMLFGVTPFGS